MELPNFCRGRRLYSAGRPSRWASAHILVDSVIAVFLENSENDSKLKDWINFGIYWKNSLSYSQPWPWVCGLGLGLACLGPWPWLSGLGLALTRLALLKSLLSAQGCAFWGFVDMPPHLGCQIPPKKLFFLGVNRRSPAKLVKSKNMHLIKVTASIPTKFCTVINTTKCF